VWTVSELEKVSSVQQSEHSRIQSKYLASVDGSIKGTIIHEVLRGRDASTVLKEYGEYSEEHVQQCEEIVARFFSSDLMKLAKRSYCELSFVITFDGKQVTGKIDRLCELSDGSWIVIDYKSEAVLPEEYANLNVDYAVSMSIYVEAIRQTVEGSVTGALYFTETGEFIRTGIF